MTGIYIILLLSAGFMLGVVTTMILTQSERCKAPTVQNDLRIRCPLGREPGCDSGLCAIHIKELKCTCSHCRLRDK